MHFISKLSERSDTKVYIRKNHRLQTAILMILASVFLLSGCMNFVPYVKDDASGAYSQSPLLYGMTASEDAVVVGNQAEILFTVQASDIHEEVLLCWGDQQISPMNDDGQNGDILADDGIYSAVVLVDADRQDEILQLYAKTGSVTSETVEIRVFDMPTQRQAQQTMQVISMLQDMQLQYSSSEGFVPEEQIDALLNQAETFALEGKEQGIVTDVVRQDDAVEI